MADQGDFSTLMAEPCDQLDHPPISHLFHDFCGSALPAPSKFWRSAKSNEDWGSTAADQMRSIRKAMALANGEEIVMYEPACWGISQSSLKKYAN